MTTETEVKLTAQRRGSVIGPVARERVIAEGTADAGPWLVMFDDGEIREFGNRKAAEVSIKRRAAKLVPAEGILVTEIEWRYPAPRTDYQRGWDDGQAWRQQDDLARAARNECPVCGRMFKNLRGLSAHQSKTEHYAGRMEK